MKVFVQYINERLPEAQITNFGEAYVLLHACRIGTKFTLPLTFI
jgi:hypothetical protein